MQHLRTTGTSVEESEMCDEYEGSQEERRPILTEVMKQDFTEELELEMGNVGLVRFQQARRANRPSTITWAKI